MRTVRYSGLLIYKKAVSFADTIQQMEVCRTYKSKSLHYPLPLNRKRNNNTLPLLYNFLFYCLLLTFIKSILGQYNFWYRIFKIYLHKLLLHDMILFLCKKKKKGNCILNISNIIYIHQYFSYSIANINKQ